MNLDLVLLPGMDGTARLYSRLVGALPVAWVKSPVQYPADDISSYEKLLSLIECTVPTRPYLLVAESYSVPLAIQFAAKRPEHLKGLVLCAGFASSPVRGWRKAAVRIVSPYLFRVPLQDWILRRFLVGEGAEVGLIEEVRRAIGLVKPKVLSSRLVEIFSCDVRDDLARVEVPILYLQAEGDRLVDSGSLEEFLRPQPTILVKRISGPHLLFQREPARCVEAIVEFLRWNDSEGY